MIFGMDFNQVQELIRMVSKHKLAEFILKEGDFKLIIRNQGNAEPSTAHQMVPAGIQPAVTMAPQAFQGSTPPAKTDAPATAANQALAAPPAANAEAGLLPVKSPMVGTFYRSPGPDKGPFVKVGDTIEVGSPVCIIEAMKLFNEIESDVKGKIVKVLVEDASPVEYDQPLFLVDPA